MITKAQVDQLGKWARWTDRDGFIEAFGESFGCHLWDKFIEHDRDFLAFWNYLDNETAQQVLDAVNKGTDTGGMKLDDFLKVPGGMKVISLVRCPRFDREVMGINGLRCCLPVHHPGPHVYCRRDNVIVEAK